MIQKRAFFIFIIVPQLIFAQNSVAIINNYIDSTGGHENWRKIKSMYLQNQSFYEDPYNESVSPKLLNKFDYLNRIFRKWYPDKQKTETYKGGVLKLERYCLGQSSYLVLPHMKPMPSLFPNYYHLHPKEFHELINRGETGSFKFMGTKKIRNKSYYVVQIPLNNIVMNYYFNKQSMLLEYAYFLHEEYRFIKYEDYRQINGVKLPFRTTISNEGIVYFEGQTTKIEFNIEIEDSVFEFQ